MVLRYLSHSPEATAYLGGVTARHLRVGDLVALIGPLGAGKTCFVAGLAKALRVRGRVASPSFIIARWHPGPVPLVHADAYRLGVPEELLDAGLDEWLQWAVVALEWADRVLEVLPAERLTVSMQPHGQERVIEVRGQGRGAEIVEQVARDHPSHRDLQPAG
jgi:tRNA threonylcarbamoyladenosine biosynthesis protein TsaE